MTNDQTRALAFLYQFLERALFAPHSSYFASLQGYAGVGKTWLIGNWLEEVLANYPDLRITVVAPTNKAVDVLRAKCGHLKVQFRTLDSFLGFRVKRDDDWKMQRHRNTKSVDGNDGPDFVVCDEASMVKKEYHEELRHRDVPVLYVGDPAQLQPVGEEQSPAFTVPDTFLMQEVARQAAGHPIIEMATYLRGMVNSGGWFTLSDLRQFAKDGDRRIAFTNYRNVHDWAERAIEKGMDARILAFTNAAVGENNAVMHKRLYPDAPLFGKGEMVLVNEAFDYDDETLLCNGELLRVEDCHEAEPIAGVETYTVTAKRLASSLVVDGETVGNTLTMHCALDPELAVRVHRDLTNKIYEARAAGDMGLMDKLMAARRPLNKLAPLRHSFSNTIHKSQGSTYDVALLDFPDIYRSREMRARLFYVGATRPSQYLVLAHSGG